MALLYHVIISSSWKLEKQSIVNLKLVQLLVESGVNFMVCESTDIDFEKICANLSIFFNLWAVSILKIWIKS